MQSISDSPRATLAVSAAIAAAILVIWLIVAGADGLALTAFLVRLGHVVAAMVWIGLIVFVNFVLLVALGSADEVQRSFVHKAVVPRVAWWFRHASTMAVVTGVLLLLLSGYLLPTMIYGAGVFMPPARVLLLWGGVVAALAMWMFVHMYIWPNMQVVLGLRAGDDIAKAAARARVILFARLNLLLSLPVVLAMVAAAHLY
ncbi:MAG TPA: hypothetical protein VH519_10745 [Hyphomicrobiaceae bacterium]|jgi:uncharacterized membrane protein